MKKFIIILLVGLTLLPLLKPGLFDVHDPTSAFRIFSMFETIKDGQFPAAWSNLLNFGYGYPLHLFYAPLFSYLGVGIVAFIGSYELAVKMVLILASLSGALGVYKLARPYGAFAAILSATSFTFLPYRASSLYVRGSYSEFLAMSLLPWVIYFWQKGLNDKTAVVKTAILTALFVLSHNTLLLLFVPIIILLIIFYQRKNIPQVILTLIIIFGLTAWYTLPVAFERNLIQVDSIATQTNFQEHFVALNQLWYSAWGYGGSASGIAGDQMSFMLGKGQLILALLGALALFKSRKYLALSLFGFTSIFAIFLTTSASKIIWELFPTLAIMQFPWRALAMAGVGLAALSGGVMLLIPQKYQLIACSGLIILLISTNLRYFRPQEYRNYNYDILSSQSNLDPLVKNKIPEYLPVYMPTFPDTRPHDSLERTSTKVTGHLTQNASGPLVLNIAYMPQWQLSLNSKPVAITPDSLGRIMTIEHYESGDYQISLIWHRTQVETLGLLFTALSVLAVIGLWVL